LAILTIRRQTHLEALLITQSLFNFLVIFYFLVTASGFKCIPDEDSSTRNACGDDSQYEEEEHRPYVPENYSRLFQTFTIFSMLGVEQKV
jgi:hypothetical protein